MRTSTITAYLRKRAAEGAALLDVADEIDAGALRPTLPAPPPVVRRPRQLSTLAGPERERAEAVDARKRECQRAAGTLPKTMPPLPMEKP